MRHYFWTFLWAIVVLLLCVVPPSNLEGVPRFFEGADKVVHIGFFFIFSTLLFHAAIRRNPDGLRLGSTLFWVISISVIFAVFTELLQWKVFTYRSGELWDLFADFVGIGMATFSFLLFRKQLGNL